MPVPPAKKGIFSPLVRVFARLPWFVLPLFAIFLTYAPFMGGRVVRMAGDDKVYVGQALEMFQNGRIFLQTLFGEPNYYKGPLHYLLLQLGMLLFGRSMWATVYMNLAWLLVGSFALGLVLRYHLPENRKHWASFGMLAFGVGAGLFGHAFASQMEVGLAALFAIGAAFLDRSVRSKNASSIWEVLFWLTAGISGWSKSPLHSVLMGTSALVFWTWKGVILEKLRSPLSWLAVFLGIFVGVLGFAPAFLLDRVNFIDAYIMRETLLKPDNGGVWWEAPLTIFTYFLFPFVLLVITSYLDLGARLYRKFQNQTPVFQDSGSTHLAILGASIFLPSVLFFLYHPYRGHNYNLPVIAGVVLLTTTLIANHSGRWTRIYGWALSLTACLVLILPILFSLIQYHFSPMPEWWSPWVLPTLWMGSLLTSGVFFYFGFFRPLAQPRWIALASIGIYLGLGPLMVVLGEREMVDLRKIIREYQQGDTPPHLAYYNVHKHLWSEWGYLNFMIQRPVKGVHNWEQLKQSVLNGDLILIPGAQWLNDFQTWVQRSFPSASIEVHPWRRWRTHSRSEKGRSLWVEAWSQKDLNILGRDFYIVSVTSPLRSSQVQ